MTDADDVTAAQEPAAPAVVPPADDEPGPPAATAPKPPTSRELDGMDPQTRLAHENRRRLNADAARVERNLERRAARRAGR